MIDIIIPAYNSHDYIENALCSIIMQTVRDKIKVYIVDDCSDKGYEDIIKKYKGILNIKELKTEVNSGPGVARQVGLDNSNSKYVMFIDSDDIFNCCYSVEKLYTRIEENKSNVVSSYFVEETDEDCYDHGDNSIWVHGKIYRRDFLNKKNIRFNDTRANEDTGFNKLILLLEEFDFINEYTYIWKCNKKSITRSCDYTFYGLEGYVYNIAWAIEEGIKRNANTTKIVNLLYENILELYYRYIYYSERKEKHLIIEWTSMLKKYLKYLDYIDYNDKISICQEEARKFIIELGPDKFNNNKFTLDEFIKSL